MGFLFGQPAIQTEPKVKPPMTQRREALKRRQKALKWKAVAPFVKKHFKTDMTVRDIEQNLAAEASYQEYLRNKDKK